MNDEPTRQHAPLPPARRARLRRQAGRRLLAATLGCALIASGAALAVHFLAAEIGASLPLAVGIGLTGALLAAFVCALLLVDLDLRLLRPLARLEAEVALRRHTGADPPPIRDEDSLLAGFRDDLAALLDDSGRLRRETARTIATATRQLEIEQGRLEAILAGLREGVIVASADHRIILFNPAAAETFREAPGFGLGRPLDALLDTAPLAAALDGGGAHAELALARKDGGATLDVRFGEITPPAGGGQRAYVLSFAAPAALKKEAETHAPTLPARPVHYDFDLLDAGLAADATLTARPLAELDYVVFDTETTGLDPSGGDRLIQLGAVRMRGGTVRPAEVFDSLIDPGMAIPPASTRFHGITDADVAGAPGEGEVLRRFHDFAAGCVLVAHNAAFDMRFLQLGETASGRRFDNPVLDMLLLSVAIHADYEDHTLDGLAARFDVEIRGRHTALGDARVTAEIFARMLDLLAADGIVTLEDAFAASRAQIALRRLQERF